jgi:membrane carboxypeptidase/penicillin-binding protein
MEKYLETYPQEIKEFTMPAGVIKVEIDRYTGKRYGDHCLHRFWEAFLEGTEPDINDKCTEEDHLKITDYFDRVQVEQNTNNAAEGEV